MKIRRRIRRWFRRFGRSRGWTAVQILAIVLIGAGVVVLVMVAIGK